MAINFIGSQSLEMPPCCPSNFLPQALILSSLKNQKLSSANVSYRMTAIDVLLANSSYKCKILKFRQQQ